jgi:hypothetical protein
LVVVSEIQGFLVPKVKRENTIWNCRLAEVEENVGQLIVVRGKRQEVDLPSFVHVNVCDLS